MIRFDVIFRDGTRRRAFYDFENPNYVNIAQLKIAATDEQMQGAVCVTSNRDVEASLKASGFKVKHPRAEKTDYTVSLTAELAHRVSETAEKYNTHGATVIRYAIMRWVDEGCPYPEKKK